MVYRVESSLKQRNKRSSGAVLDPMISVLATSLRIGYFALEALWSGAMFSIANHEARLGKTTTGLSQISAQAPATILREYPFYRRTGGACGQKRSALGWSLTVGLVELIRIELTLEWLQRESRGGRRS